VPSAEIDEIDRHLIRIVQADASRPLHALGEQVGLSGSAVQRRLTKLRQSGVISNPVSIVNPTTVGLHLTIIVHLSCERDSADATAGLEHALAQLPEAKHVYRVTGDTDFTIILIVPGMDRFNEITREIFTADPNIRSYRTHVVLKTILETHQVPV